MAIVILFGGGKLFQPTLPVVMYFDGSVKGLQLGSAITFRGVNVGKITDIELQYDASNQKIFIPVGGILYAGSLALVGNSKEVAEIEAGRGSGEMLKQFINRGLRAQQSLPNFVTNQVNVTIDFLPQLPATFIQAEPKKRLEIPTVPSEMSQVRSTLQDLVEKLSKLPLEEIIGDGRQVLAGANRLLNDPQTAQIIANANQTLADAREAVGALDAKLKPILANAEQLSGSAKTTVAETNQRLAELKGTIRDVDRALGGVQSSMDNADQLLGTVNGLLQPGAPLTYELINTLREVASAARSARALMTTFERDPNAILLGRPPTKAGDPK
ncbi:MAG: MlaD family protein [Rhodospirillales bacterium]